MSEEDKRIEYAVRHTEIIRQPKQSLATFGNTNIAYYLLTTPVYKEITREKDETVIRQGRVIAEKPRIVTPYYMSQLEGFSQDARRYFDKAISEYGPDAPGLYYSYRNEPQNLTIVSEKLRAVADRLNDEIDKRNDPLVTIIKGQDELWDVSLMRFIYDITRQSMQGNMLQMQASGLMDVDDGGVPLDARLVIEEMFKRMRRGETKPEELKKELERWNLFDEYQDRFFVALRRR